MSGAVDPVAVLEVSYAPHEDERAWLSSVATTLRPLVDTDRLSLHAYIACGIDSRRHDLLFFGGYPKERLVRVLSAPFAFPPVASDLARPMVEKLATQRGIATLRPHAGESIGEFWGHGVHDNVAFICADGQGEAVVIAALTSTPFLLSPSDATMWRRVAVHVGAARRLLRGGTSLDSDQVESVLTPAGKVVDARGRAQPHHAREQLRDAVRAIDRARTRRGRADPEAALAAWSGLFAGRWSLIDHFDSDGRRFVVARPNDPDAPMPGGLTRRQRQVAFYGSLGWSNKEIGYALGLAPTTVSMHMGHVLPRLGLKTRLQLVQMATRLAVEAFDRATQAAHTAS